MLRSLYYACGRGSSSPASDALVSCLCTALATFDDVFIIIDALDECITGAELMSFPKTAIEWAIPSMHLLVTSRKTAEIDEMLSPIVQAFASLTARDVDPDIQLHVVRMLREEKDFTRWDRKNLIEIEEALISRAAGMYAPFPNQSASSVRSRADLLLPGFAGLIVR